MLSMGGSDLLEEPINKTVRRDLSLISNKIWNVCFNPRPTECLSLLKKWDLYGPFITSVVVSWIVSDAVAVFPAFFMISTAGAAFIAVQIVLAGADISILQATSIICYSYFPIYNLCLMSIIFSPYIRLLLLIPISVWSLRNAVYLVQSTLSSSKHKAIYILLIMKTLIILCFNGMMFPVTDNFECFEVNDEFEEPVLMPVPVSLWEIIYLSSYNFAYGFTCGTFGLFMLPAEGARLYPQSASVALGFSLLIVGVSQLVCPVAGYFSDAVEASSCYYKRRPFIVYPCLVASMAVFLMCFGSLYYLRVLYYFMLLVGMTCINIMYSVNSGLVYDYLTKDMEGWASGVVAAQTLAGSSIGFFSVILARQHDYHWMYIQYVIVHVICNFLALKQAWVLETRKDYKAIGEVIVDPNVAVKSNSAQLYNNDDRKILGVSITQLKQAYVIDTSQGYDFFWVFISRTFYYIGVSVQAFILFYLRDVIGTTDESEQKKQIGMICILAQTCAAMVAYPLGRLSDHPRVGKKALIYVACGVMSIVYCGFLIAPYFGDYAFSVLVLTGMFYGIGNGCFLSVDYGLAVATLPDKEKAAQSLGVWGVSSFIGSAIGPLLWGILIQLFGGDELSLNIFYMTSGFEEHYSYNGYAAMVIGGIISTLISGILVKLVKAN